MTDSFEDLDARGIWESVPDGLLLVEATGSIRLANLEAERMFAYGDGMVGLMVDALMPEPFSVGHKALREGFHERPQRRTMGAGQRLEAKRADGSVFPVQISLAPLGADLVIAAVRDVTDLAAAEERQIDSAKRRILAEDHERIAKDMHDTVIQELFALGMSLQAAGATIRDPEQAARVEAGVNTLDDVIRSIRALIFDIRGEKHGDDLRVRVVEIATSLIPSLGFEPSVSFHGPVERVPTELHDHILAVARESLTNVARHAEASAAAVDVVVRDQIITITVSDDGIGMPENPSRQSGHTNLAERARMTRESFWVAAHPDGGTTVEWRTPIDD